jgi:tyrosyl-tRNA synthetase
MYGKVMSLPDIAMGAYFRLVTGWTPLEIADIETGIESGALNPRDVKMKLAREIVSIYWGEDAARESETGFIRLFQDKEIPDDIPVFRLGPEQTTLDVLEAAGLVSTRSDGRRLMEQNGVRLDDRTLKDPNEPFPGEGVLRVGKRKFVRIAR